MVSEDSVIGVKKVFNMNDYVENGRLLMYWFDGYED